jgi:hypothetical protein
MFEEFSSTKAMYGENAVGKMTRAQREDFNARYLETT